MIGDHADCPLDRVEFREWELEKRLLSGLVPAQSERASEYFPETETWPGGRYPDRPTDIPPAMAEEGSGGLVHKMEVEGMGLSRQPFCFALSRLQESPISAVDLELS